MPAHSDPISTRGYGLVLRRAAIIAALGTMLGACNTAYNTAYTDYTATMPSDYRERHPISIREGERKLELFVGADRGGLTPMQRAEVAGFAGYWRKDATGGVIVDRPVGAPNERAANNSLREVVSILAASGIPHQGIFVRPYQPKPGKLANLRLRFPQMTADAGPCGLRPDDLGPTYNTKHYENQPYWNLGCASQRALAAMVENPADLVQPRAEMPAYTAKRNAGIEKWRKGESPATHYPDPNKGSISELGK